MSKYIIKTNIDNIILDNDEIISIELKQYNNMLCKNIQNILSKYIKNKFNSSSFKIIIKTKSKIIYINYENYENNDYKNIVYVSNEDYNALKDLFDKKLREIKIHGSIEKIRNNFSILKIISSFFFQK